MAFDINLYRKYGYSRYPEKIDTIYERDVNGSVIKRAGEDNYNAVGNTSGPFLIEWANKKDIVSAEHVTVLQDIIFSMQNALGTKPFYSTKSYPDPDSPEDTITGDQIVTVSKRLRCIENSVPDDYHINSLIAAHKHGANGVSAVNLASATEVTGLLDKANIDLTMNSTGINATNMLYGAGVTIKAAIDGRLSLTGGTVTGPTLFNDDTSVKGNFNTKSTYEAETTDFTRGAEGVLSSHFATGYTGQILCNKGFTKLTGTGTIGYVTASNLMYGRYTAIVRVALNLDDTVSLASQPQIFTITVGNGSGITKSTVITGAQINADKAYFENNVRSFCVTFDYGKGPRDVQSPLVKISYPKANTHIIGIQNVAIVPAHTATL